MMVERGFKEGTSATFNNLDTLFLASATNN
jgi:hypothetical protein